MRLLSAATWMSATLLLSSTPALAQMTPPAAVGTKPKAVATIPVRPAMQPPQDATSAMAQADRLALQSDLAWTGQYNGAISGEVSERMVNAIKAYQKLRGGQPTGVLTPQERAVLADAARRKQESVGWKIVTDPVSGARLGVPTRLVPQQASDANGSKWTSPDGAVQIQLARRKEANPTAAALADHEKQDPPGRTVDYTAVKPDFFVLSGQQGPKKFYIRGTFKGDEVRVLTILYDQASANVVEPVVIAMSGAFTAFPAASAVPPPRRSVDYGTGIVVSEDGAIVADRDVTDGCIAITIPSSGHADRIADVIASVDGHLYLARGGNGPGRTSALYRFDPARWQSDAEPVVSIKGFDFDGDLVEDHCTHKVLGLHYDSDALGTAWLDPAMAAAQAKIDAALPGRVNIVQVASCASGTPLLVTSTSDRAPEQYFLYGPGDAGLRSVSESRPTIDPRQMADTDFYRIKARDGREFPVYVTRPHGKGPWPTVVLVHGGPNARGWSWEWDDESQFLASRGYLVVKPEFRGSAGYGTELEAAGFRQWGLATQDDIADATRWAAAQGWSDAKRTCIAGASFGGYATLMGLIRYPELYRCGIAYSAVADIGMMYETWWSDLSDDWKGYGMPVTVGDREKDAAQFIATSPLKLAARIKQPLLLTHGGHDQRVPIEQATAMHDALEAAHAPVTWVYYPEECHGFCIQKDRFDFYRRMEAFLAANIGAAATNASAN